MLQKIKTHAADHPRMAFVLALIMVVLSGICLGFVCLYFSAGSYGMKLFKYYLTQPKVIALNLLPFVVLNLLLYAVFNRAWTAFVCTGVFCLTFSWAQYWKLLARNDAIYAEDLAVISEAAQMSGEYIRFNLPIILSAVAVVLGTLVLFFLCRGRFVHKSTRLGVAAMLFSLCCWFYPKYYTNYTVYYSMENWSQVSKWSDVGKYISRGGIYPFINSIPSALPTPPAGYNAEEAELLLSQYTSEDIAEDKKVSVIFVQLEAFADFSQETDAITGVDPYESYHKLLEESYWGTLVTNVFAGNTIDTERGVLTGYSLLESFRREAWSYARYFTSQGYTVNGAHAGHAEFYNRNNVNANLGIEDYRFIEGYYEYIYPTIPRDDFFLQDIADYCLEQMESDPVFSFNVTYQNHGPYNDSEVYFYDEYVPQGSLSYSDYMIINNYLAGIANTGDQVLAMTENFRDSDKPVILVFFGDHKPWLGDQSVTYNALGIDITSQNDEAFYNYYGTEYVMWANDAAKEALDNDFVGTGPAVSPCFLMNVLFQQCGWEGPGYMKFTNEIMDSMPLVHTSGRYLVDGALVETESLDEGRRKMLEDMSHVQYYLSMDAKAQLPS